MFAPPGQPEILAKVKIHGDGLRVVGSAVSKVACACTVTYVPALLPSAQSAPEAQAPAAIWVTPVVEGHPQNLEGAGNALIVDAKVPQDVEG